MRRSATGALLLVLAIVGTSVGGARAPGVAVGAVPSGSPDPSRGDLCAGACPVCPLAPAPGDYSPTPSVSLDARTRATLGQRCIPLSRGSFAFGATVTSGGALTSVRMYVDGNRVPVASRAIVPGRVTKLTARVYLAPGRPARPVPLGPGTGHEIELIATDAGHGVLDMKFGFRTCSARGARAAGRRPAPAAAAAAAPTPEITVDAIADGDEVAVEDVDVEAPSEDKDSKDPVTGGDNEGQNKDPKTGQIPPDVDKCAPGIKIPLELTGTQKGDQCEGSVSFKLPDGPVGLVPQGIAFSDKRPHHPFLHGGLNNGRYTLAAVLKPLIGGPGILPPAALTADDRRKLKKGVKLVITTTTTQCTVNGANGPETISYKPPKVVTTTVTLKLG